MNQRPSAGDSRIALTIGGNTRIWWFLFPAALNAAPAPSSAARSADARFHSGLVGMPPYRNRVHCPGFHANARFGKAFRPTLEERSSYKSSTLTCVAMACLPAFGERLLHNAVQMQLASTERGRISRLVRMVALNFQMKTYGHQLSIEVTRSNRPAARARRAAIRPVQDWCAAAFVGSVFSSLPGGASSLTNSLWILDGRQNGSQTVVHLAGHALAFATRRDAAFRRIPFSRLRKCKFSANRNTHDIHNDEIQSGIPQQQQQIPPGFSMPVSWAILAMTGRRRSGGRMASGSGRG